VDGGIEAVNLKVAEQYVAAFAQLAKQNNTVILPANGRCQLLGHRAQRGQAKQSLTFSA
jgi:hypothetical protein